MVELKATDHRKEKTGFADNNRYTLIKVYVMVTNITFTSCEGCFESGSYS